MDGRDNKAKNVFSTAYTEAVEKNRVYKAKNLKKIEQLKKKLKDTVNRFLMKCKGY